MRPSACWGRMPPARLAEIEEKQKPPPPPLSKKEAKASRPVQLLLWPEKGAAWSKGRRPPQRRHKGEIKAVQLLFWPPPSP